MRRVVCALLLAGCATAPAVRRDEATDARAVEQTLGEFLHAFEGLDFERFRTYFADDACAFFPGLRAERACGRAEIEATFRKVFDAERQAATSGPPYLRLEPEDLHVQILGPDAAIATFQLRNSERLARRTFVFARRGGRWRIVHLHASNIAMPR